MLSVSGLHVDLRKPDVGSSTGEDGAPGLSAYELAVANGFTGTETEWLSSLNGEPGTPAPVITNVSEFVNDAGYLIEHQDISGKQDNLISGNNIKTINGETLLGSGDITVNGGGGGSSTWGGITGTLSNQTDLQEELDNKNPLLTAYEWSRAIVTPMGKPAFAKNTNNYATLEQTQDNYSVSGNITIIKRFHAGISAYSSKFILMENDNGDSVSINNSGYSFKFIVKKAGVQIFNHTIASSTYFPNLSEIIVYFQVDYDLEQLIIERDDGSSYVIPSIGINAVKDSVFTNIDIGINSYYGNIKDWFLLSGLFNYAGMGKIFDSTDKLEDILPALTVYQKSVSKVFSSGIPTSVSAGTLVAFVNGVAQVGYFTGTPYFKYNGITYDYSIALMSRQILAEFSIDIIVGNMDFIVSGQTSFLALFRAIEKDTGQVIEARNIVGAHSVISTIPVGRWKIYHYQESSLIHYALRIGNASADLDMYFYDDYKVTTLGVALSAHSSMADYDAIYCPYSKQVMLGGWGLTGTYLK